VASNQILAINILLLSKSCEHTVVVFVDHDLKAELPLHVERITLPGRPPAPHQA